MDDTATLRRFNRSFTQRIGVLDDSFLGTGRPLGPARLLFEIGAGCDQVVELRRRLGLDSGYLSRLLRSLEADGLVQVVPDTTDRRRRIVRLTTRGRRQWDRLDERSEQLAGRIMAPLSARQRADLADALATAERILRAATVRFEVADPSAPSAQFAMTSYFHELDARFDGGFDAGPALAEAETIFRPPTGLMVVVFDDAEAVGCGGLQRIDDITSEVKRMWIAPDRRGLGLGRRLLGHLERLAAEDGRRRVVLDTNSVLDEAIAMYASMGYEPIERYNDNPYAHHWFAKSLA